MLESPASNGMGTELLEQFFGEMRQNKGTKGVIDKGGDGRHKESLDQEGPEQYVAKFTCT